MVAAKHVGLIGLGAMGRGMAGSLRRAGYTVHVCDARPGAAAEFAVDGGVACASPAEVAAALHQQQQHLHTATLLVLA